MPTSRVFLHFLFTLVRMKFCGTIPRVSPNALERRVFASSLRFGLSFHTRGSLRRTAFQKPGSRCVKVRRFCARWQPRKPEQGSVTVDDGKSQPRQPGGRNPSRRPHSRWRFFRAVHDHQAARSRHEFVSAPREERRHWWNLVRQPLSRLRVRHSLAFVFLLVRAIAGLVSHVSRAAGNPRLSETLRATLRTRAPHPAKYALSGSDLE